jgi:cytoskeletal protein RodZ
MELWSLVTLALLLMVGVSLCAQQPTPPTTSTDPNAAPQSQPTQSTDPTGQQSATPPQGQPNQTPNQGSQAAPDSQSQPPTSTSDTQTFVGTIVKSGDKYMLQDAASGKSYDIDHQDQVKP